MGRFGLHVGGMLDLTRGRLKASRADLVDALHGRVTDHHRFMIRLHLSQIDALESAVAASEARIGDALGPFRAAVNLLTTMPGLSETTARVLIAEIDPDMSRFPWVGLLISWAGFCPRLDESGGKRRATRTRQSAPWLKRTLVNAAWAATRKKDTAILAVASSMLRSAYFMLRDGAEFHDLGHQYLCTT